MKLDQIRWERAAKLGAGVLLAVAFVVALPSLLGGEKPAPLPPDVGLPQAAIPPPPPAVTPAPPPPRPPKKQKHRAKAHARHKKRPRPKLDHKPRPPSVTSSPAWPAPTAPMGTPQSFGFER